MKIRNTLIVFLVGALIALPLKTYQLLTSVDYSSGFFKSEGALNIILPVLLVLCVVGCYVTALMSKNHPQYSPNIRSPFLGLVCGGTALAIGWESASDLLNQETARFEGTIGLVYSCLGLICVLAFLFPAVSFFMGNNLIESRPVIMMLPVLWMGMRMVLTFFDFTTRANINESIYDLVFMVFMTLFLLAAAKFLSGAAENSSKMLFGSGCAAVLFGALVTLPRFILALSGKPEFNQLSESVRAPYRASFSDLLLTVLAIGMMFYASVPVRQRMPQRVPMPAQQRPNMPQRYQQPQRAPYGQAVPAPMMRQPYMQAPRRPVMQRPLPGAGPDAYTTRGAGMRVAEEFGALGQLGDGTSKYGGIDSFRDDMLSGRRALEVLESSVMPVAQMNEFEEESMVMMPTFTVGDIAELSEPDETSAELEELNEEVTESLSSLFAQRENAARAPREAVISAASDETGEELPAAPEISEPDYPPPPPPRRSVSLGSGRHGGRLADRLSEMEERRSRRAQRTPVGRMPYGEYDDPRYGTYEEEEEYYDDRRSGYGRYDEYDEYSDYGDEYDDEYYEDVEYGASDYDEYDDDGYDDYDDEYDDGYDDEYDDDDYGDDGDYDYDDEGYGAPRGGYNYW